MLSSSKITTTDPAHFIDALFQDTFLFVMAVRHDKQLVRDEAFYRRGCVLVEELKARLTAMKAPDDLISHVQYAQCGVIDYTVFDSATDNENAVWWRAPLEGAYLGTLRAGEVIPDNLRRLLREPAPDMRLLVLYQRIYALGYGHNLPGYADERRQAVESLDALVPAPELPPSSPVIVEHRPGVRRGLLRSRLFHVALLGVMVAGLYCGLSYSLHHFLLASLSG
ncbi:DotU family type IV/VI secretion system protein [Scandinavium sp. M-37]|uniref:DotU family type IV/VI secretion system protein n=1 Tax=Scandinavium sp. M-37 TaxID=3373077 RepID=UPI003745C2C9